MIAPWTAARGALALTTVLLVTAFTPPAGAQSGEAEYDGDLAVLRRVAVPTVLRSQTARLVDAGLFDCNG